MKSVNEPRTWTDYFDKRPKRLNKDIRFGTWNIRSMYRMGSLMTVSRELSRYRLNLVGVQEVRWDGSGTKLAGEYTFFYIKRSVNHELGTGLFVQKRIMSGVKTVECVSNRI
jgi:hypothetical protein